MGENDNSDDTNVRGSKSDWSGGVVILSIAHESVHSSSFSFICYTRWKGGVFNFQFPMKLGLAHITAIRWRCLGIMYSSEKAKFLKKALCPWPLSPYCFEVSSYLASMKNKTTHLGWWSKKKEVAWSFDDILSRFIIFALPTFPLYYSMKKNKLSYFFHYLLGFPSLPAKQIPNWICKLIVMNLVLHFEG